MAQQQLTSGGSSHTEAASELLRALRGPKSQRAFAKRLGYRGNPITDWEHGRRFPTASETLRVAAKVGIDLDVAFSAFHPVPPPTSEDGYAVANWLDSLRGTCTNAELAQRAGRSRFAIGRWLAGHSVPRLPDFLRFIDAINGRAAEWVATLVPIELVPSLEPTYRSMSAARQVSRDLPWSEAVLRVIETKGYEALSSHSNEYIASVLELDPELVAHIVEVLEGAGAIRRGSDSYRVIGSLVVDTNVTEQSRARLAAHWAQVAQARVQAGKGDWFAYNVISVSQRDCSRIEQILRAAFREIRGIVKESTPTEQAALLTLQLTRWETPSPVRSNVLGLETGVGPLRRTG